MKIVGIDASLSSTGVCNFETMPPRTRAIQSKAFGVRRLIEIREEIRKEIEGADLVVFEGYAFKADKYAHQIGELGGVLRVLCFDMRIRFLEVNPAHLKKFAVGKGNASKEQVAVAIYKKWGKEFATNDEGDAFILAVIGNAYLGGVFSRNLYSYQQEVIDELQGKRGSKKKAG